MPRLGRGSEGGLGHHDSAVPDAPTQHLTARRMGRGDSHSAEDGGGQLWGQFDPVTACQERAGSTMLGEPTAPRAQGAQARAPHPHAQTKARLLPQQAPPRGPPQGGGAASSPGPAPTVPRARPLLHSRKAPQTKAGGAVREHKRGLPDPPNCSFKQPPQRGTGLGRSLGAWVGAE